MQNPIGAIGTSQIYAWPLGWLSTFIKSHNLLPLQIVPSATTINLTDNGLIEYITIYTKLVYSFYYASSVVCWISEKLAQTQSNIILDYSSIVKQLLFWWLAWNVNGLGNIKQGWVPGGVGWWVVGGFGPNILSLLVLIEIRIRLKLGCDN